jgi:membrane fusion protein (multidrug efflux system)
VVVYSREDIVRPGKVVDISDSVDPDTRAFRVDVLVENADGELKPGMFGRSEIVTERRRDTISVPKSVVLRRNNQDVVFIADKEADAAHAIARQVPVETGLQGKDEVEILLGLESGQMLVVRGYEVLQDRTPVNAIDVDEPIVPEEPKESEARDGVAGGGGQQGGGGGSRRGGGGGRRG